MYFKYLKRRFELGFYHLVLDVMAGFCEHGNNTENYMRCITLAF